MQRHHPIGVEWLADKLRRGGNGQGTGACTHSGREVLVPRRGSDHHSQLEFFLCCYFQRYSVKLFDFNVTHVPVS